MEAWPILSDPRQGDEEQYLGWPKTIAMQDNYAREAAAHLPTVHVQGTPSPMIQVLDEERNEVLYTLRIEGPSYRPKVFREGGHYTIRIGDDEAWRTSIEGVRPKEKGSLKVSV